MGKLPKEQEALTEQSAGPELPPPEYAAADDSAPDTPPPGYTPGPSPYQTVPVGWNLYSKPYSRRAFHIGPHAAAPVYSLELHTGLLSSRPFLVLRPGRDTTTTKTSSSPPLATARRDAPPPHHHHRRPRHLGAADGARPATDLFVRRRR
ncbi:hypothetical protein A9K55_000242 [Cordyceps militaris]|uniref:Uncharacterized protein n=1 Tax=Cordyceps militaris TaxID=73501 RepID=A0A2H4SW46_CORMI|nr:hypothetical protein A9K55_000242 [Cordyceps militaris]